MAQSILDADWIAVQLLSQYRTVDVDLLTQPSLPVRGIDENAIYLASVHWQQRLQGVQVIAVNDQVAV